MGGLLYVVQLGVVSSGVYHLVELLWSEVGKWFFFLDVKDVSFRDSIIPG
jgi:hypothetical protein